MTKRELSAFLFSSFSKKLCSELCRKLHMVGAKLRLNGAFDFNALAKATPGYVGADLSALTGAAGTIVIKRIFKNTSDATTVPGSYLPAVETDPRTSDTITGGSTFRPLAAHGIISRSFAYCTILSI